MKPRILIIENDKTDFYKSRLPLISALINEFDFFCCFPGAEKNLEDGSINTLPFPLILKSKSPLQIISLSFLIKKYIEEYKITIIHSFRFQPNLIASLAKKGSFLITHVTGLGYAYTKKFSALRIISSLLYNYILLRSDKIITQNPDDFYDLNILRIRSFYTKSKIIFGSGVDTKFYHFKYDLHDRDSKVLNILFVSRLLKSKGVLKLIEAVNLYNKKYGKAILNIIGDLDENNFDSISEAEINLFRSQNIFFHGYVDDPMRFFQEADLFCLPSVYREGIPRSLLEGLSMELPVITIDMPGCRLCVRGNGYLLSNNSSQSILNAIIDFSKLDSRNKLRMRRNSRKLAEERFSLERIQNDMREIYLEVSKFPINSF